MIRWLTVCLLVLSAGIAVGGLTLTGSNYVQTDIGTDAQTIASWVSNGTTWTHYVEASGTQFVDGVERAFTNVFWAQSGSTLTISNGQHSGTTAYNRALTADEVQTIYEYGLNPTANQRAVDHIAIATGTNALVFSGAGPVGYRGGDAVVEVRDESGAGNHGTLEPSQTTGPTWNGDAVGGWLEFDGVGEYMNLATDTRIQSGIDYSVSFWMKPTSTANYQTIFGVPYLGSANRGLCVLYTGAGSLRVFIDNKDNSQYASGVALDEWSNVVVTHDGTTLTVFVNGEEAGHKTQSFGGVFSPDVHVVGWGGNNVADNFYQGLIADVRVHQRLISPTEATNLYTAGRSAPRDAISTDGLVLYMPFDEPADRYYDNSQEANHGTIYGSPTISETPHQGTATP